MISFGAGNVGSILNMLKKAGYRGAIAESARDVEAADLIVMPGVGHFDHCAKALRKSGLVEAISARVIGDKVPFLGICVGMQLLGRCSEEGSEPGLGWIDGEVRRFAFPDSIAPRPVPHMGWNSVASKSSEPLLSTDDEDQRFYFAHSYHMICDRPDDVIATANYGYAFCAAVRRGNIAGVQFHPEKSHRFGLRLLKNFCSQQDSPDAA